ncbi:hypothetical protein CGZ92_05500 [Parenemella sanctibonifatiensis]|uniref:Uroporphyrinogen-III synthase n=1 Tax=Parenemella sanctibonifatiensis TaxID=2016505 RepID=A0A255E934_9ACTN|nr:hypothetical protein CGZ92_05500 [Parenemella sanctibonifatiensis]
MDRDRWAGAGVSATGVRVLVPRPADDPICVAVAEIATVEAVPLTRTVSSPQLQEWLAAPDSLGHHEWVLLTSPAAVRHTAASLGPGSPARASKLGVVGPGTAAAARAAGLTPTVIGGGTAADLAARLIADHPPTSVLLPRSVAAAPTLPDALREAGWRVTELPAYAPEPMPLSPQVRRRLTEPWPDVIVVTAGSTARAMLDQLGQPPVTTDLVSIGGTTAADLTDLGLPVAAVATEPTPAGISHAVAQVARLP